MSRLRSRPSVCPDTLRIYKKLWKISMLRSISVSMMALLLGALATLTGCAGGPQMTEKLEARLLERAQARWRALEQRDFDAAWSFTSPAYRGVFSKSLYRQKFSYMVEWQLTGVELVTYDAGRLWRVWRRGSCPNPSNLLLQPRQLLVPFQRVSSKNGFLSTGSGGSAPTHSRGSGLTAGCSWQ